MNEDKVNYLRGINVKILRSTMGGIYASQFLTNALRVVLRYSRSILVYMLMQQLGIHCCSTTLNPFRCHECISGVPGSSKAFLWRSNSFTSTHQEAISGDHLGAPPPEWQSVVGRL